MKSSARISPSLWISLDRDVDYDSTVAEIQEVVDGYPGLYRDLLTYLRERIKEVLTGASASIVVRIYGDDMDKLRKHANRVRDAIADVVGISDLKIEQQVLVPQIDVRLKPAVAEQFGLTPGDVRRSATSLDQGANGRRGLPTTEGVSGCRMEQS